MSSAPSPWLDRLAIGASAACFAHCLMLPFLIAALPATARVLSLPEEAHLIAFAFAVPVSAWAVLRGYRHHGVMYPALLALTGLSLLGIGALAGLTPITETAVTVAGSVLLAGAHLRNWQLSASRSPNRYAARDTR